MRLHLLEAICPQQDQTSWEWNFVLNLKNKEKIISTKNMISPLFTLIFIGSNLTLNQII